MLIANIFTVPIQPKGLLSKCFGICETESDKFKTEGKLYRNKYVHKLDPCSHQ